MSCNLKEIFVRVVNCWNHFWFSPGHSFDLGFFRFLYFSTLFYAIYPNEYTIAYLPKELWEPVWVTSLWSSPPLTEDHISQLLFLRKIFAFTSAVGLFSRVSMALNALITFILISLAQSYGFQQNFWIFIFLPSSIMAFSRAGDAFSLDKLIGFNKSRNDGKNFNYHWPIKLIQVTFLLSFFFAGSTKLIHSGFTWISSETLKNHLLLAYHLPQVSEFAQNLSLGPWLAESPLLCSTLAATAIAVELSAPFALINSKLRLIPLLSLLLLQLGSELLIVSGFLKLCGAYWSFVPWQQTKNRIKKFLSKQKKISNS